VSISLMQMLNTATHTASRSSAASSSPASSSSSPTTDPGVDLTSTFLQLLTTQLQNQSPLDPLDPNQFVVQLAQFDSLGELTQIQELMQTLVNDVNPSSAMSGAIAHAGANATSTASPSAVSH
jgi:flagellar basal-body rod modification protein FlgD